jgi:ATPase subunit of ABC transporter with duplicated ATPase domains
MPTPSPAVICSGLTFAWPDGTAVFTDLSLTIGPGRTGLIGLNGSGKSTLLRLIAGELTPARGSVQVAGELGYVPQNATLAGTRVDEALGIADIRAAVAAIEAGDASEGNFARVGNDWDAEERARATLDRLGLDGVPLDRRIDELSGGESVLLCLAAQFLRRPGVLLLDEPTNNLDLDARHRLYGAVASWAGAMVIVSHDRELLDRVDQIAELRAGEVRWYGGNLTDYEEVLAVEQEAAERTVRAAESDVRRQQRELIETRTKLDRRARYGKKMQESGGLPKMVANERKKAAQVSAAKLRNTQTERLEEATKRLAAAEEAVRDDDEIRVDLPGTEVSSSADRNESR